MPRIGVVLGSGLGGLVEELEDAVSVPFADVPSLPGAGVAGHEGRFVFGRLGTIDLVFQAGRVHAYEGHAPEVVVAPVRLLAGLGVDALVLTSAVGAVRPGLEPGDLLLVEDQMNLSFRGPLAGPTRSGEERYPDMSAPFDEELCSVLRAAAEDRRIELYQGTYACVHGPSYETRAEVRMLSRLGADVVGMSTVQEVITACALGLRVAAVSLVTNRATGLSPTPLSHDEVLEVGREAGARLSLLLLSALPRMVAMVDRHDQSTEAK